MAALYGVVVSLLCAYGISYLCEYLGVGAVSIGAEHVQRSLSVAALNLYACQHVGLVGVGRLGDMGLVHAVVNLPLTLWAVIPAFSLTIGGLIAARTQTSRGRWGMVGSALISGAAYAVILTVAARFISAKFTAAALPSVSTPGMSTAFNPLDIPFKPSTLGAFGYGCLFGLVFSYLGALLAVRGIRGEQVGKWWACAKAVVVVGLVMQLILLVVGGAWIMMSSRYSALDSATKPKYIQVIPTVTGIAYTLVFGGNVSYCAVPSAIPSAARGSEISLYSGTTTREGEKTTHRPATKFAWVAALIAAVMALLTGRLAVKYGSRDGSLPTAIRVTIAQVAFLAILVKLCWMGWGVSGQFSLFAGAGGDWTLAVSAIGVFVFALIGAHHAHLRSEVALSGFSTV